MRSRSRGLVTSEKAGMAPSSSSYCSPSSVAYLAGVSGPATIQGFNVGSACSGRRGVRRSQLAGEQIEGPSTSSQVIGTALALPIETAANPLRGNRTNRRYRNLEQFSNTHCVCAKIIVPDFFFYTVMAYFQYRLEEHQRKVRGAPQ